VSAVDAAATANLNSSLICPLPRAVADPRAHPQSFESHAITEEFLKKIPKTDLHVHLDGSIRIQTLIDLAKEQGVELPAYTVGVGSDSDQQWFPDSTRVF
jgi:hypothetical protein